MKTKLLTCFFFILVALRISAYAETPEEYKVKDTDFSAEIGQVVLDKIEKALKDFRDFSEIILSDEILRKIKSENETLSIKVRAKDIEELSDNLNWSTQNIGFDNWVILVRGSLLKSDYITKTFEYEIAKCRGNTSQVELQRLQKIVKTAYDKYQKFLSSATYSD